MGSTSRISERGREEMGFFRVFIPPAPFWLGPWGLAVYLYQGPWLLRDLVYLLATPPPFAPAGLECPCLPPLLVALGYSLSLASFINVRCLHFCTESLLGVFCFLTDLGCHTVPSAGSPPGSLHAGFFLPLNLSSDFTTSERPSLTAHYLIAHPCVLPPAFHSLSQHIFNFLHYSDYNLMLSFVLLSHICPF